MIFSKLFYILLKNYIKNTINIILKYGDYY